MPGIVLRPLHFIHITSFNPCGNSMSNYSHSQVEKGWVTCILVTQLVLVKQWPEPRRSCCSAQIQCSTFMAPPSLTTENSYISPLIFPDGKTEAQWEGMTSQSLTASYGGRPPFVQPQVPRSRLPCLMWASFEVYPGPLGLSGHCWFSEFPWIFHMLLRGGPWWAVIYLLICLHHEYLWSTFLEPGNMLDAGDSSWGHQTHLWPEKKLPCFAGLSRHCKAEV